tara:strand:+ start:602 stop:958 length:357 start_codon:yes stop_codon:yes gene_type:complete
MRRNVRWGRHGGLIGCSVTDVHNGLNQLVTTGSTNLSHDDAGNITSDGTSSFGYDSANRMVTGPGSTVLAHDGDGSLYREQATGTDNRFLYDGANPSAQVNSSGTVTEPVACPGLDLA